VARKRLPLQGFSLPASVLRVSPPSGCPFRSARLSEFVPGCVAAHGFAAHLLAVSTASRSSAIRPARTRRSRPLPQAWPPSGNRPRGRPSTRRSRAPLVGLFRPSSDVGAWVRFSRVCLTRHVPPSEFLTPSAGCSPRTVRPPGTPCGDPSCRCRSWGSGLGPQLFVRPGFVCCHTPPSGRAWRRLVASHPPALRNRRSRALTPRARRTVRHPMRPKAHGPASSPRPASTSVCRLG
jgi:hypothetical protein